MIYKPKKGEKIGWSTSKTTGGSGWMYDGSHWVQYKNNTPTGRKERYRISTTAARNVGLGSLTRTFLRIPSEKEIKAYGPGTYNNNKHSNQETALLNKSRNNIKNKNNNKGALHNENKERKNTLNLYGTDPKTGKKFLSNVHTKHYKTGERLGVLTRNQRRAYEAEAMGKGGKIKTFEGEVAKFEKKTKHGKPHKRKTLYKSHVRSGGKFTKKYSRR